MFHQHPDQTNEIPNGNHIHPEICESIKNIKEVQEMYNASVEESAKNSQDVKDGLCTEEDEKNEPGNILFNAISEASIAILQSPSVSEAFSTICKEFGKDTTLSLINLMAISMTNSAYNAITFYDNLLKGELVRNFDNIINQVNILTASVNGYIPRLEVIEKKVAFLEKDAKIEELRRSLSSEDSSDIPPVL